MENETLDREIGDIVPLAPLEQAPGSSEPAGPAYKLWDWCYFCGARFRVVQKICGYVRISDGVISHVVHLSALEPCLEGVDLDREFHDGYPEE